MIKFCILISILLMSTAHVFGKYQIKTIYHETYIGEIIERTDTMIEFLTNDDINMKFPLIQIKSIVRIDETFDITDSGKPMISNFNADNTSKGEYPFLGLALLHPGMINVNFGYQFADYGIRSVLGAVPPISYGFQLNLLYNLNKRNSFEHNISLGLGHSYIEDYYKTGSEEYLKNNFNRNQTWSYIGLFYDINFYGLFFEAGGTIGDGSMTGFQFRAQFGYVYRFNN